MDYFTYLRSLDYSMANHITNNNCRYMNMAGNIPRTEPWPLTFQDKSTQFNLNELINGVKNSVGNEKDDEIMYTTLAEMAPDDDQREIIISIKDNEMVHNRIFRKIFTELTGVVLQENAMNTPTTANTKSYMDMLKDAFMGELKAIERYRELLAYAPNMEIYSMIMYVMTDEIRHALKYNYLMMLNK